MSLPKPEPLCRYRYDPLDRLASCLPLGQADARCFYRLNRLTTEMQGQVRTSWLQVQDQLLAQWQQEAKRGESLLIATDRPGSVLHAIQTDRQQSFAYMPYGVYQPAQAPLHLPGFNGERFDPVTGHYLLGNGIRAFNPVLMRFNSPDSLSPFGKGGINTYGYCGGDPVNRIDPSGHTPWWLKWASAQRTYTAEVGSQVGIIETAQQSLFRRTGSLPEDMPPIRQALDKALKPEVRQTSFGKLLAETNENLGSHRNSEITWDQVEAYTQWATQVHEGKISNTTAHAKSSGAWARKIFTGPHPRSALVGAVFNAAATLPSAAAEANALKTGAALRVPLPSTPQNMAPVIRKS